MNVTAPPTHAMRTVAVIHTHHQNDHTGTTFADEART
jgi:hypothetical protein